MKIKLLALDMDGTTLKNDHITISPANLAAIQAAVDRGIEVVSASGRMLGRTPAALGAIRGLHYAVTSNGAAVYRLTDLEHGEPLYVNPLPKETALAVIEAMRPAGVYLEVYCGGCSYTTAEMIQRYEELPIPPQRKHLMYRNRFAVENLPDFLRRTPLHIEKINMPFLHTEIQEAVSAGLRAVPGISRTSSLPQNAEINAAGTSKADGLSHLCRLLGIAPDEVMAVGDNENDVEMLAFAGVSAAPANAESRFRSAVDFVTASNEEDGVAVAIRKFLL